jgi:hypothetical protein
MLTKNISGGTYKAQYRLHELSIKDSREWGYEPNVIQGLHMRQVTWGYEPNLIQRRWSEKYSECYQWIFIGKIIGYALWCWYIENGALKFLEDRISTNNTARERDGCILWYVKKIGGPLRTSKRPIGRSYILAPARKNLASPQGRKPRSSATDRWNGDRIHDAPRQTSPAVLFYFLEPSDFTAAALPSFLCAPLPENLLCSLLSSSSTVADPWAASGR